MSHKMCYNYSCTYFIFFQQWPNPILLSASGRASCETSPWEQQWWRHPCSEECAANLATSSSPCRDRGVLLDKQL